ncbi:hypothetical protein GW17_00043034, partial [Ensete ventricosum]
ALALLHPHYATTVVAAPTQAAAVLARRQPLCQGVATPAAGTSTGAAPASAAVAGGRPCKRQPLRAVPLLVGCLPGRRTRNQPPLAGWPRATVCRPLVAAPTAWPRAVAAPCGRRPLTGWPWPQPPPLCRGPCRSWPPLSRASFAVKMQQEYVE